MRDRAMEHAEQMGYEAGRTKPNETNCHFSLFATKELMEAWSMGNRRGLQEKAAVRTDSTTE